MIFPQKMMLIFNKNSLYNILVSGAIFKFIPRKYRSKGTVILVIEKQMCYIKTKTISINGDL
jgi:hypothetical protein